MRKRLLSGVLGIGICVMVCLVNGCFYGSVGKQCHCPDHTELTQQDFSPQLSSRAKQCIYDAIWATVNTVYLRADDAFRTQWGHLRDETRPRVLNTETDLEFYTLMKALIQEHTDKHSFYFTPEEVNYQTKLFQGALNEVSEITTELVGADHAYLYIHIPSFAARGVAEQFTALLQQQLKTQTIAGIILDVKDNGGGTTTELEGVLQHLLPKGSRGYHAGPTYPKKEHFLRKQGELFDTLKEIPMVALSGAKSASAAELFLAIMQYRQRAMIVGVQTRGLMEKTEPFNFPDGSRLFISIADFYLPNGVSLTGEGIRPDVDINDYTDNPLYQQHDLVRVAVECYQTRPSPRMTSKNR